MEIVLASGTQVIVGMDVDEPALARGARHQARMARNVESPAIPRVQMVRGASHDHHVIGEHLPDNWRLSHHRL